VTDQHDIHAAIPGRVGAAAAPVGPPASAPSSRNKHLIEPIGRGAARAFALWHTACMFAVGTGCIYIGPVRRAPENEPPVVLLPVATNNDLTMESDPESFEVMAYDPEGDSLYFLWSVPHAVAFETLPIAQVDDIVSSVIKVDREPVLDGDQILCAVSDSVTPEASTVVVWNITVEQAP
jgi:hypothetical protein